MNVTCYYRNDPERPLEDPVLEPGGRRFVFRLVKGTWLDPIASWGSNWFHPPYPNSVLRLSMSLWYSAFHFSFFVAFLWFLSGVTPSAPVEKFFYFVGWLVGVVGLLFTPGYFIAFKWPFIDRCFYAGWKVYGVDAPEYKEWLCPAKEVYEGSKALCLSVRPFAKIR